MEDEDLTQDSSAPPPITADAYPEESPLVCPENRDPDDDELADEDDGEDKEKIGEAERCDRDRHSPHPPSPVTIAKSADPAPAVGIPVPKPSPPLAASGREDCWSEGATWALIEAWGERHLRAQAEPQSHQRGGLRQKDWEEVMDAVCSRGGGGKQAKSEGQCKNRIDTLKKKYKVERLKPHSSWPYFRRLNDLVVADYEDGSGAGNEVSSKLPAGVGFGSFRHQLQQLQMKKKKKRTTKKRSHRQLLQSVRPPHFLSPPLPRLGKEEYSSDGLPPANGKSGKKNGKEGLLRGGPIPARHAVAKGVGGPEAGLRELARAVMRLGEVYERVENSKLRQAEEMEKRRMGLTKELEVQRMDFFMKTLMELSQRNHKKPKRLPTPSAAENHTAAAPVATDAGTHSNKSGDSGGME